MGARGQLKIPSHLRPASDHKTAGTVAETVPRDAPTKPEAVSGEAELSRLWDEIVPELAAVGLIAPSDGLVVELALRHFLLARQASDQVGDSVVVKSDRYDGTMKKHPAEAVFRAESGMFMEYAKQLGMTFVARARTPAARVRDNPFDNPFMSSRTAWDDT